MSLGRQTRTFALIGGLQWVVDWMVLVVLSGAGVPVSVANVAGRVCGASLGFWLNGRFTFASADSALGRRQLARFILMWLGTTVASTLFVTRADVLFGLHWAWLIKPLVEVTLAAIGFVLSRHWVYRR